MNRWLILFTITGLLAGCSTSSEPEPEETDPPMKPMSASATAPESVLVDQEAAYSAQCATEDGILHFEMIYDGPDHSFEKVLDNPGTNARIDTVLAHSSPGEVTIDVLCENDYEYGSNQRIVKNARAEIVPPADVEYTQTSFTLEQYETMRLNLLDFIDSAVAVDSTHAISNNNDLQIERVDANTYEFTSAKAGQKSFELYARNVHGSTDREDAVMDVASVEPVTVRVQNNDTDKHTNGLVAHLGVYDTDGERLDTLSSSDGVFEIPRSDAIEFIRARYTKNGDAFSFVRTDRDIAATFASSDTEHITRVVDYYLRDKNGKIQSSLKRGARKIESPEGFRKWVVEGALDAVGSFNGDRSVPGTTRGTFNCYTESEDGRSPDVLLVAEKLYFTQTDETSTLTSRVKNIIIDEYQNQIAPWMGEFAPELEVVDYVAFDSKNNEFVNRPIFGPESHPDFGVFGRVGVTGAEPNSIYSAVAIIRSVENDGIQDHQLRHVTLEEGFAAIAFMSRTVADDWADPDQSVAHEISQLTTPSLMDGKLTRANWEQTYGCADQQGNSRILYLNDVFGSPE